MNNKVRDTINLKIDFDEILHAFETSSVSNHWFIDIEKNELININKEIDDDYEGKLEEISNKKYISIPERMPSDDFSIIELFIYQIAEEDYSLSEEFYKILDSKSKPFRRFKDLLEKYPEQKGKWFKFKDNHIKNELVNWLFENNIMLEREKLIPDIKIKELNPDEFNMLPDEWKNFGPLGCMNCDNHSGIKARIFLVDCEIGNAMIDYEVRKIMKEKYNINHFGILSGDKTFLTASKCPECGSENIFWDF